VPTGNYDRARSNSYTNRRGQTTVVSHKRVRIHAVRDRWEWLTREFFCPVLKIFGKIWELSTETFLGHGNPWNLGRHGNFPSVNKIMGNEYWKFQDFYGNSSTEPIPNFPSIPYCVYTKEVGEQLMCQGDKCLRKEWCIYLEKWFFAPKTNAASRKKKWIPSHITRQLPWCNYFYFA